MGAIVEQLGSCLSKTEVSGAPLMKSILDQHTSTVYILVNVKVERQGSLWR